MKTQSNTLSRLQSLGINLDDALELRRISMTLSRWAELECGDSNDYASWSIERDETTDKPYIVRHPHSGAKSTRSPVADREKGALKRLAGIMSRYPDLMVYHQTDPRGASLYILRASDAEENIESTYSRGLAVTR